MIDVTKVRNGKFKLIKAHNVTPNDFITLSQDYGITNEMLRYTQSRAEIPRFVEGQSKQQKLFLVDIPAHDKNMGTVPLAVVINDNTSLVVFTNEQTEYVVPIMSKYLNEKGSGNYTTVCLCLDVLHTLANKYLDRIKDIDKARVEDKKLLRDKTKKHNSEYVRHLTGLLVTSSSYTDSLSSDKELLLSSRTVLADYMDAEQKWFLSTDIVIFKQAQREAQYSQDRIRLVLHSFRTQVSMSNNNKLRGITLIQFLGFLPSMLYSFMGINLPNGSTTTGLPLSNTWQVLGMTVILIVMAWAFYRFYIHKI